jgi:DNA-binding transcriptional MerR regulator
VQVDLMSIGEFARRSRLAPKALRLYDELGLLPPARVGEDSAYRYYAESQLDRARLIAALRQLQISLAEIKSIVDLEPDAAAEQISRNWTAIEAQHTARRDLAHYLVDRMQGKRHVMYEVATREIPVRSVLCLKRSVEGTDGAWAFGKEFVSILREHHLPMMKGRAGAVFSIYWGEVSDDSDGPVEWCRPVPTDQAEQLAVSVPELVLRNEPAHREAFVHLGPEARSNRRSGSSSRRHCMLGSKSTRFSRVSWAPESRTAQIRPHHRAEVLTATSPFRSPDQPERAIRSFALLPSRVLIRTAVAGQFLRSSDQGGQECASRRVVLASGRS